jgi:hypothetical protein
VHLRCVIDQAQRNTNATRRINSDPCMYFFDFLYHAPNGMHHDIKPTDTYRSLQNGEAAIHYQRYGVHTGRCVFPQTPTTNYLQIPRFQCTHTTCGVIVRPLPSRIPSKPEAERVGRSVWLLTRRAKMKGLSHDSRTHQPQVGSDRRDLIAMMTCESVHWPRKSWGLSVFQSETEPTGIDKDVPCSSFLHCPRSLKSQWLASTQSKARVTISTARSRQTAQRDARGSLKPSLDPQRPWMRKKAKSSATPGSRLGKAVGIILACLLLQ